MCLAVPCEVVEVAGRTALVSVDGALREVDLSLVDGVGVGSYVLVHAGFAIERWSEQDVLEWKAMLDGTWSSDAKPSDAQPSDAQPSDAQPSDAS